MKQFLFSGGLIGVAVLVGIGCSEALPDTNSSGPTKALSTELVKTDHPQYRDFQVALPWLGRAESTEAVEIRALEPGVIVSIDADDETPVVVGTQLFALGGERFNKRLAMLQTQLAMLQTEESVAEKAVRQKQQSVTQKLASPYELTPIKEHAIGIRIAVGQAAYEAQRVKEAAQIHAPLSGIFTHRRVSVGQVVERGTPLADVIGTNRVRIVASFFPPEGVEVQGLQAAVELSRDDRVSGIITKVLPRRTMAGSTMVWIEGDAIDRRFKPGESLSGSVILHTRTDTLAVPEGALVRDEGEQAYLFVEEPGGFRRQAVQIGLISDGWLVVLSGISHEDEVVVEGAYELFYRDFNQIYKVLD